MIRNDKKPTRKRELANTPWEEAEMDREEMDREQREKSESDWMNTPYQDREISSSDDWRYEFDAISRGMARIHAVMYRLEMSHTPTFERLREEIRSMEVINQKLRWYFCQSANEKWCTGQRLTKEDFHLLAAMGLIVIENAFEDYDHFYYEDDERKGYISTQAPDPPPVRTRNGVSHRVSLKLGIMAENVRITFLREEQLAYFRKHEPALFSRFNKS